MANRSLIEVGTKLLYMRWKLVWKGHTIARSPKLLMRVFIHNKCWSDCGSKDNAGFNDAIADCEVGFLLANPMFSGI